MFVPRINPFIVDKFVFNLFPSNNLFSIMYCFVIFTTYLYISADFVDLHILLLVGGVGGGGTRETDMEVIA